MITPSVGGFRTLSFKQILADRTDSLLPGAFERKISFSTLNANQLVPHPDFLVVSNALAMKQ